MKLFSAVAVVSGLLTASLRAQPATALTTAREVERIAATGPFWPGFDPLAIPLAIYDGKSTWLFRHPNPPSDFQPSSISSIRSHVREGRHPAVTANSSADIGGVMTATLLVDYSFTRSTTATFSRSVGSRAKRCARRSPPPTLLAPHAWAA